MPHVTAVLQVSAIDMLGVLAATALNKFQGVLKRVRDFRRNPEALPSRRILMSDLIIRELRQSDEREWRRLFSAYLRFYESEVPERVYTTTFERLIGQDAWMPSAFVAAKTDEEGSELGGLVHSLYHSHCWREERVCYLQDLFADPQVRGLGVGRSLIEAVYRQADQDDAPAVYWLTQDFNKEARKLYDRIASVTPFIKYAR